MKETETRKVRGYKVTDKVYEKALKRGQREKTPLATLLEKVVYFYGQGQNIAVFDKTDSFASKIQLNGK